MPTRKPISAVRRLFARYGLRAQPVTSRAAGVRVWRIPFRVSAAGLRGLLNLLPAAERGRAFRRRSARLRHEAVVSYGAQRLLLAQQMGIGAAAVKIERSLDRKPRLAAPSPAGPAFNASHAGNTLVFAIGGRSAVGIDIEMAERRLDPDVLASRVMSADEQSALQKLAPAARRRSFLQLWTRKEAVAKADGRGLAIDLASLDALATPGAIVQAVTGMRTLRWSVRDLALGRGCIGALAVADRRT
jgi:4'-phosphopantetheinyl transferase